MERVKRKSSGIFGANTSSSKYGTVLGNGADEEVLMKTIPRQAIKSLFPKKEIIYILTAYTSVGAQEPEYIALVCNH